MLALALHIALALAAGTAVPAAARRAAELPVPAPRAVVEVPRTGAAARAAPTGESAIVGRIRGGATLAVRGASGGPGCSAGWIAVDGGGVEAWLCGAGTTVREGLPNASPWPPPPGRWAPLPFLYVHPLGRGRELYAGPAAAFEMRGGRPFPPGTWESIQATLGRDGVVLFRTVSGLWARDDQVRWAEPSGLSGVPLDPADAPWPFGFVVADRPPVLAAAPQSRRDSPPRTRDRLPRHALVRILEEGDRWVRIGYGRYLRRSDVVRFRSRARPEGVGPEERWIDVDLAEQVLAVYDGDVPIYASLASAGRGGTTREGTFRVRQAMGTVAMRGLPTGDGRRTYEVNDVPWALFFDEGRAIHAAFWHDEFGAPRSHRCVNLPPVAARRVFELASPRLPPGWLAAFDDDASPRGTVVHVHR